MRFRHYDSLRTFLVVARHQNFSSAAEELHLSKGAISYQIRQLENELGFSLFDRLPRGIALTSQGQEMATVAQEGFDGIERKITNLRHAQSRTLTIGMSTYFASRWLSPRLMQFMAAHPDIRLRVQPMVDLINSPDDEVDLTIRWGNGKWTDCKTVPFLSCPAFPTGNAEAMERVTSLGHEKAFRSFALLRDRKDSAAWFEWFNAAALKYEGHSESLIIPDPNVRVQAVIDGQGVALNDALVQSEIEAGRLFRLSDVALIEYGYFLAYDDDALANPDVAQFVDWITATV